MKTLLRLTIRTTYTGYIKLKEKLQEQNELIKSYVYVLSIKSLNDF